MPVNWVPNHIEETQVSFHDWGTEKHLENNLPFSLFSLIFLLFLYFPIKGLDAHFPQFSLEIHFLLNFLIIFSVFGVKYRGDAICILGRDIHFTSCGVLGLLWFKMQ